MLRAVKRGRLVQCLVLIGGKPKIADVALADQEWAANTDLTKAPASVKMRAAGQVATATVTPASALASAAAEEKRWKAKRAELDFQVRSGELVSAKEVEARLVEDFARFRTKALGVPSKAKQLIPALTASDVRTLARVMRELLEELASMHAAIETRDGEVA